MRKSQYLALFHVANFSTMWVQEKNLPLYLQILKLPPLLRTAVKSSVIPICRNIEIPEKGFCRNLARHEDTVYVGCNYLHPYHHPITQ